MGCQQNASLTDGQQQCALRGLLDYGTWFHRRSRMALRIDGIVSNADTVAPLQFRSVILLAPISISKMTILPMATAGVGGASSGRRRPGRLAG